LFDPELPLKIGINVNYNVNPAFANLNLVLKPSMFLAYLFASVGALASFCLIVCPLPLLAKIIACAAVVYAVRQAIMQHALLSIPSSIIQLYANHQGEWFARNRQGNAFKVRFHAESFVSAYLTVLICLREEKHKDETILLFQSRLDQDAYRRLRIILRWHKSISKAQRN
jgi:hypothetical protein